MEKFSCHYEADLDRSGYSVLDIRPLLWKNGWPVGGDNFKIQVGQRTNAEVVGFIAVTFLVNDKRNEKA